MLSLQYTGGLHVQEQGTYTPNPSPRICKMHKMFAPEMYNSNNKLHV